MLKETEISIFIVLVNESRLVWESLKESKFSRKHFEVSSEKHQTKHCLFAFNKNGRCFCLRLWVFFTAFAGFFACVWRVFLPAVLVFLPTNCMYFCLQKQAVLHASRGQICMSSAVEITSEIPNIFR